MDNGTPGSPVEGHVAESGGRLHVRNAGSSPTPGAAAGQRLAATHHALLIHQKAEENHRWSGLAWRRSA
ncbi:hypothetical protein ACLOJK_015241 [Asimina triloba]